ncbi:chromate efflux transporter [Thalassotalea maritima]|uniref:chromate efflux transporter n=1 Tax=Thalassotalea maritima TaxID=3242416 RepID=UPI003527EEA7
MMNNTLEVFYRFFLLGWISFGGPAAHIGYFQKAFVDKLQWLDNKEYGKLVALSQFLPGPGSSQVGFAIGLQRAGLAGAIAAFLGFTLPSFLLMYALAQSQTWLAGSTADGIIHGLKLLAVVVVADACVSMYQSFCKTRLAKSIAALSLVILLVTPGIGVQIGVLLLAAIIGAIFCKDEAEKHHTLTSNKPNYTLLLVFFILFLATPWLVEQQGIAQVFAYFYQSGALVFGGGHVVLPLLQETAGQNINNDTFLMGYAAAQAVPGPMFTLASFLGAHSFAQAPFMGSLVATLAIFLPGFLLVLALQGAWQSISAKPRVAGAVVAINAAVVGLLLSALYSPVFTLAVVSNLHMALVATGLLLLRVLKLPIGILVVVFALAGILL